MYHINHFVRKTNVMFFATGIVANNHAFYIGLYSLKNDQPKSIRFQESETCKISGYH